MDDEDDDEHDGYGDHDQSEAESLRGGDRAEPKHEQGDHDDGEDAAQVIHRILRLLHVRRHHPQDEDQCDDRWDDSDEEDRSPPEVLEERSGDDRADHRAATAHTGPQCDRLDACGARAPQGRDQCQGRGVGHTGGDASEDAPEDEDVRIGCPGGNETRGDGEQHAEAEHQFAAVAISEGSEVEDAHRQSQGAADGNEVELRLTGAEGTADIREGDVGDSEIDVGHERPEDEGTQDEPSPRWGTRGYRWSRHARPSRVEQPRQ